MAKVALLVGVSEYEPGLNPLPGSVQDVDAMQRVLVHPELGGFAETDITVLKNPQRQAMEDAIYWLFNDRKKDDLLLFYFSGHGIKDENGRLYLATRATRKDSNGRLVKPSAVAATSLHENINESRSQRQVMILDCCFSGAIAQGMTVKDDGTVNLKDYLGGKGRAILTSSTSTEYSFGAETVGHDNAGLSIYTRYLVEGIEKGVADTDGDGWIAVEELHEYAATRVKEVAPAMTPKFYPVEEGYKIVLARSRKDDPKLKYRKEAQTWAERGQGQFSIVAKRILEGKQIEWAISANEAKAIEDEVLQPYREYKGKQQEYEQTLAKIVQASYPLSATTEAELKEYQQYLGLRDADIAAIEERIFSPLRAEYDYQQQEAERLKQEQEQAEYTNELQRCRQEFEKVVQAEYPKEVEHQEKLRQELERLRNCLLNWIQLRQQKEVENQQQEDLANHDYAGNQRNLGIELHLEGKLDEAIVAYRQAIQLNPDSPLSYYNLGVTLEHQGRLGEAIVAYRQAIKLDSSFANAYNNLGVALKAEVELSERISALASYQGSAGFASGQRQVKLSEAIAAYRQAIQLDPNFATAHSNLGVALETQGKLDEAIASYRQAIQLDPNLTEAHRNLENLLKQQGKKKFLGLF
jgi:uncharacterized caspase-like protein/Flp pilus assembly protein TadD